MKDFTPDQVRAMSLAEAALIIDGFTEMNRAQSGVEDDGPPTSEEVRALFDELDRMSKADGDAA